MTDLSRRRLGVFLHGTPKQITFEFSIVQHEVDTQVLQMSTTWHFRISAHAKEWRITCEFFIAECIVDIDSGPECRQVVCLSTSSFLPARRTIRVNKKQQQNESHLRFVPHLHHPLCFRCRRERLWLEGKARPSPWNRKLFENFL